MAESHKGIVFVGLKISDKYEALYPGEYIGKVYAFVIAALCVFAPFVGGVTADNGVGLHPADCAGGLEFYYVRGVFYPGLSEEVVVQAGRFIVLLLVAVGHDDAEVAADVAVPGAYFNGFFIADEFVEIVDEFFGGDNVGGGLVKEHPYLGPREFHPCAIWKYEHLSSVHYCFADGGRGYFFFELLCGNGADINFFHGGVLWF